MWKKIFKKRFWTQVMAIVLVLALNLGAADGLIKFTMQELALGTFDGFLKSALAKDVEVEKNKNTLPEKARKKEPKNPKAIEAKNKHEVKSKRTLNSKTFEIAENKFRKEVYQEPIHYVNEKNEMVDIDNTLVETKNKDYSFENRANKIKTRFADRVSKKSLGQIQQKLFSIEWALLNGKEVKGNASRNTIIYRGINQNVDLKYIVDGFAIKEEIILNSSGTPTEYKFKLDLNNLDYEMQEDGSIAFVEPRTETVIWVMPKPFMYDTAGERSDNVQATIALEKGETVLTVTADEQWIESSKRQFPIVIDPTFQPGGTVGRDNSIYSKEADKNLRSEDYLYVGNTLAYGDTASFFYFSEVESKEDVTVTSATFQAYAKEGELKSINLFPIQFDWGWDGKDLTWNYWEDNKDLGSLEDTASGPAEGWWYFDVTNLVQKWVDDSSSNYGFALFPQSDKGYIKFYSCDNSDSEKRPNLSYEYVTGPVGGPANFELHIDRKTGLIKADGTAVEDARIYLDSDDGQSFHTTADSSGEWEEDGMSFEEGKTINISMYYEYEVEKTDKEGNTYTETITSDTTSQKFLTTRYSKGARTKKLAKFYYNDGTKAAQLKEVNEIETELEMVVGDYVLVLDPLRNMSYTAGPIIEDPDREYRLREKIRPLYSNGEMVGDYIDAATGNFYPLATDIAFPAKGLSVEFTRVVNSQEEEMYRGPLGQNWHLNYDKMLIMYEDGSIEATGGDGGGYFFRPSGNSYISDNDVTEKLVENGDGTYSVITKYDTEYHFNIDGMLDSITDSNGNTVTLNYDPEGLLEEVVDAGDRTTTLYYDDLGRIELIVDPEENQTEYKYDTWGRLHLVEDPNDGVTEYKYDPKNSHWVTKVIDQEGYEIITNTYNDQGQVETQTDAEDYGVSIDYNGNITTFIDKNLNQYEYIFDNEYRLLSIAGPPVETGLPTEAQAESGEVVKFSSGIRSVNIDPEVTTFALSEEDPVTVSSSDSLRTLVEYHYDPNGYRDRVTDTKGHTMYYDYDNIGNLLSALNDKGKGTRYEYNDPDNENYPTDIYDALENNTQIEYYDDGNIHRVTNAEDETTVYTYFDSGLVETITDPAEKDVAYTYYPDGNVESFKDGRGNYTYYYYDDVGRIEHVAYPEDKDVYYEYDDNGNLEREYSYVNGELVETNYRYYKNNLLEATEDPEGNVTSYFYDKRGYLEEEVSPLTNSIEYEYDGNGNRIKVWDAEDNLTEYKYNDLGWLKKIIEPSDENPAGDITNYYYDANGNKVGVQDPLEEWTVYTYDDYDRLETITDPSERTATYSYDDLGNVEYFEDFDGTIKEYDYDKLSRVEEILVNGKYSTKFTYDPSGNRETVTNPLDQTYIYRYDDNNNLWQIEDPEENIVEFGYDKNNNRESVKDQLDNETIYHYDELNRVYEIIDPLERVTSIEYYKNGQRKAVIDGNKHATRYKYDADGRLRYVFDAKEKTTEYKYDKAGNLRFFWDANRHKTEYKYNKKNLLVEVINHLGQNTTFEYNENGNIEAKTDGNKNRIEYDYDELNRLQGVYYPDETYVEYGYNEEGKREWMEDMYGTTWYDYDDMGRLNYVTNQDDITIEYDYNDLGQKTLVRYPDEKEVIYTYNDLNRLETVEDRLGKVTTYKYDNAGRRTTTILPNGVVTSYEYDKANQLRVIESVNAEDKLLAKYEYEYDDAGNRKIFSQTVGGTVYTTEYKYDPVNQLELVINPDDSQVSYEYDDVGNRLKMTRVEGESITTTKYQYNEVNELVRFNVDDGPFTEFRYDDNGNRIAKIESGDRITNYSWDMENRLTKVQIHQDKWVGFEYDGDGNRITKFSAMTMPEKELKNNGNGNGKGKGLDPTFTPPGQKKVKKQQEDLMYMLLKKGGNGGGNSGGNSGNSGNSSEKSNNGKNNSDKSNGNSKSNKDKSSDRVKNKDLTKEERQAKKDKVKANKGYRQKGKYNNKGKHLGWYKNGKIAEMLQPGEKVDVTYYLNDVSDSLTQVLMTYNEEGNYNAAYNYGLERISVEAVDETRPEVQDPLYYLYDGLGSVTFMVKPDGNKRDHYRYDAFGKPAPGNSKLSEDGRIVNHNTFGYTGEMWDQEAELLYLRARYYEPETGRFLSRDSYWGELENPLSKHLYAYVGNNPVNYVDPTGHVGINAAFEGIFDTFSIGLFDSIEANIIATEVRNEAVNYAKKHQPKYTKDKNKYTKDKTLITWDNEADAYRHFKWNARMTREIGIEEAEIVATRHESMYLTIYGDYDGLFSDKLILEVPTATLMDLWNNQQGRLMANQYPSLSYDNLFKKALNNGQLITALDQVPVKYGFDKSLVNKKNNTVLIRVDKKSGTIEYLDWRDYDNV